MPPPPTDAGGSVGLQLLDSWDRGFEPRGRHGCSSLLFVVCCTGSGLCDEPITHTEEFYPMYVIYYKLCVYVCVCVCVLYYKLY